MGTLTITDTNANLSRDALRSGAGVPVKIEVRGNSSAKFPKKQYDLELEAPAALLGLPKHKKWVLAAPYADRLHIRNTLGFALARSLADEDGQPWYAPRTRPFELFLNGRYQGVSVLTEKIQLGLERVRQSDDSFLVKVERPDWSDRGEYFRTASGTYVTFADPKVKKLTTREKRVIPRTIAGFERALLAIFQGDFQSYRPLINARSFQNFILVIEIFKNVDGFRRSIYASHREGRMHAGPVWDFDLAIANVKVFSQMKPHGFQVGHTFYIDLSHELFWFRALLRDPAFQRELVRRYRELRRPGQALSNDSLFALMDQQSAAVRPGLERNFTVWSANGRLRDGVVIFFVPKRKHYHHEEELHYAKKWLAQRLAWLDENIEDIGR